MRAAVLEEYGAPLTITDVDEPTLTPDGAIVSIEACGICRSDWHAWLGHGEWADDQVPLGQILGHEPVGTVTAVGEQVESIAVGDRVVIPFSLGDGTCPNCQQGHGNVCRDGYALGFQPEAPGAFAEAVAVPAAEYNLEVVPEWLSSAGAAALGCRYMTAYNALINRAGIDGGEWLAVYGCGGVGLSTVQLASALDVHVVGVDPSEAARTRASDLGAEVVLDPSTEDPVEAIHDLTDGGADLSMDALGIAETCQNSIRSLRERGIHLQTGLTTDAEEGAVSLPTDWMTRWEISFLGARGMPPTDYSALFTLLGEIGIDPAELVAKEVALADVSDRLAAMSDYRTEGVEVITEF